MRDRFAGSSYRSPFFYIYDAYGYRVEVEWTDATPEQHEQAIERMLTIRDEVDAVIDRHKQAIEAAR